MATKEFPYQKINFILSVLGFIGSIGFYYGVLRDLKAQAPTKAQIERLEKENRELKKLLSDLSRMQTSKTLEP